MLLEIMFLNQLLVLEFLRVQLDLVLIWQRNLPNSIQVMKDSLILVVMIRIVRKNKERKSQKRNFLVKVNL